MCCLQDVVVLFVDVAALLAGVGFEKCVSSFCFCCFENGFELRFCKSLRVVTGELDDVFEDADKVVHALLG